MFANLNVLGQCDYEWCTPKIVGTTPFVALALSIYIPIILSCVCTSARVPNPKSFPFGDVQVTVLAILFTEAA